MGQHSTALGSSRSGCKTTTSRQSLGQPRAQT
ncbi:TPA: hypothetical protein N0F65_007101 [Lagenidium giganteum]|uniref:Uncharacterized protein n=1 Tax=Lagenidium giganteum TaxID=4803 RepID=A0AAV2YDZ9_9STRA|nr:TPA: hypothetical protein N0F65_007101 [Lagenidium giganteum]